MAECVSRPAKRLTHHVYQQLFHSGISLSRLRDIVGLGQLLHPPEDSIGIPGRSLAWKLFLLRDEPLERPPNEVPSIPIEVVRNSRKQFSELLLEKMRAPDGSYDESFIVPGFTIPRRGGQSATDLETNNPLSLHDENPWKVWFTAVDLRKTIQQDVERTFPDMGYFRNEDTQHQLTNVLFLYSIMHPHIGYRQGMHELLAPLYYAIDFDSVSESLEASGPDPLFSELCARSWVAADAWALFSALMRNISHWYEWREPVASSVPHGPINLKPYISPIIQTCTNIQGTLLKSVDPILHDAMQSVGIEPQMYGLRWLRLLFTREFPMSEAMMLWDGLFASSSPIPEIVQWTCVAMLIRIRAKLIPSDYSTQLTHLFRYPPCPTSVEGAPHHILLLIRQATALEILHTPAAGASLAVENRNLLNIPLEVPDPPTVPRRRPRPIERTHQAFSSEHTSGSPPSDILRQQPSFQLGFPELIARGLLDRGESLGINKTVMNAVSELKRNLPDLTSTLVRPPSSGSSSISSYPLLDERTPIERSSRDHQKESESARELAELRRQNKHLGEAVSWIWDVLNQEMGEQMDQEHWKGQKEQSMESLAYIRDVLVGQVTQVDERRLWGKAEFKKRWEAREQSQQSRSPTGTREIERPSGTGLPSLSSDNHRNTPNTPIPSSVNESLRGFISSTSGNMARATSHSHSQSSGAPLTSRAAIPPRAPVRVPDNNPFQRPSERRNVSHSFPSRSADSTQPRVVVGSSSPHTQGLQHDPLGVLK